MLLVMFALYLGLYHGLFGLLLALIAARRNGYSLRALVFTPFAWVAVELARTYITGFPWDLLGTTQIDNIPLVAHRHRDRRLRHLVRDRAGEYRRGCGVPGAACAAQVPARRHRSRRRIVLHAGKLVHAPVPLANQRRHAGAGRTFPILDSDAWTLDYSAADTERPAGAERAAAAMQAGHARADHLAGIAGAVLRHRSALARNAGARSRATTDSYIIAGSMGIEHTGDPQPPPDIYNSASVIAPNGAWTARYDKIHLVPFGEYVPFERLFSFAERAYPRDRHLRAAAKSRAAASRRTRSSERLSVTSRSSPTRCGSSHCNGAEVFVNISNDGWYGEGGAPRQHLNMARMRAVENNRWLLRDTNTGITAVIDPYGRVVAEAPRNQRTALQARIFSGGNHHVLHPPRRLVPVSLCDNHVGGTALRSASPRK